jgi:hypothetical protein
MADLSALKGRIISLSFKKSTSGLTPAEEQEMAELKRQLALQQMGSSS